MATHLNLNQLQAFYLAARYGSMTIASTKLHVSPPAVTMQIKKLEEWLGFNLFHRKSNMLELSAQGKELYPLAEAVFDNVATLEAHIAELIQNKTREIALGTYHIPAQHFIPDMLRCIAKDHPQLHVPIVIGTQDQSIERLLKKDIQIALIIGPPTSAKIQVYPLFEMHLVLAVAADSDLAPDGKITLNELTNLPIAMQPGGTGFVASISSYFEDKNIVPQIINDSLSSDIIKKLLPQKRCAAFFVPFAIEAELHSGILRTITILEGMPLVQFNLAFLSKNAQCPQIQDIIESLSDFCIPHSFCSLE